MQFNISGLRRTAQPKFYPACRLRSRDLLSYYNRAPSCVSPYFPIRVCVMCVRCPRPRVPSGFCLNRPFIFFILLCSSMLQLTTLGMNATGWASRQSRAYPCSPAMTDAEAAVLRGFQRTKPPFPHSNRGSGIRTVAAAARLRSTRTAAAATGLRGTRSARPLFRDKHTCGRK